MLETIREYVNEQLGDNQFLQGGVILGAATTVLYSLKPIPIKIWNRIRRYCVYEVLIEERESYRLYHFIERWLHENYKGDYRKLKAKLYHLEELDKKRSSNKIHNPSNDSVDVETTGFQPYFEVEEEFVNDETRLSLEQVNDWFYIWKFRRLIRISQNRDKLEHASSLDALFNEQYFFRSWFGRKAIERFLDEIILVGEKEAKNKKKVRTEIYSIDRDGNQMYMGDVETKDLDKIIINDKQKIIDDLNNFQLSRQWYKDRSIPYKRGMLFKGLPGNGKTTLAVSIAKTYEKNVFSLNLTEITNRGLIRAFSDLPKNSVLLLEDVDAMFSDSSKDSKREIKSSIEKGLNFSTLLNCLDGIFSKEGVLVIMTTNHPEKLDPALIRPGRIDSVFDITNPDIKSIEEYTSIFFEKEIKLNIVGTSKNNISMVVVQDICIRNKDSEENAVKEIVSKLEITKDVPEDEHEYVDI